MSADNSEPIRSGILSCNSDTTLNAIGSIYSPNSPQFRPLPQPFNSSLILITLSRMEHDSVTRELLDIETVAKRLSVCSRTIRNWMRSKKAPIPYYRLAGNTVRFKASEVEAWVQSFRLDPGLNFACFESHRISCEAIIWNRCLFRPHPVSNRP